MPANRASPLLIYSTVLLYLEYLWRDREAKRIVKERKRTMQKLLESTAECGKGLRPAGESSSLGDKLGDARRDQCIRARVPSDAISDRLRILGTRASKHL